MEKPSDSIGNRTEELNEKLRRAEREEATKNRFGDQNFDRYSSEVGYSGTESWASHTDDTGAGMYAPQDPDSVRRSQSPDRPAEPRGLDEPHTDETQD